MVSVVAADSKRKESSESELAATLRYIADGVRNSEEMEATKGTRLGALGRSFVSSSSCRTSSKDGLTDSCEAMVSANSIAYVLQR